MGINDAADRKPRLLLVSGASLVGTNILLSLAGRRHAVEVFATNSGAEGSMLGDFDGVFLTPTTMPDTHAFEQRLLQIIGQIEPDLVIPCRDDDVPMLAALRERRPEIAPRLLCGDHAVACVTHDKHASGCFSAEHGLPFAPSLRTPVGEDTVRAFAREFGYPLIIKPVHGFASRDVWLAMDESQLLRAAAREACLIQRYLGDPAAVFAAQREAEISGLPLFQSFEGLKHSIQLVIGPNGECVAQLCAEHVMRHGASVGYRRYDGEDALALGRQCAAVFSAAGWRGPLNIQCQRTPQGDLQIYEYNGRMTGGTAARRMLGLDEVAIVIEHFTAFSIPAIAPFAPSDRVTPIGLPSAESAEVKAALLGDGVWWKTR